MAPQHITVLSIYTAGANRWAVTSTHEEVSILNTYEVHEASFIEATLSFLTGGSSVFCQIYAFIFLSANVVNT